MHSDPPQGVRPLRMAALLAIVYLAFCSAYIWLSGVVAARESASVVELQHTELLKGLLFVATTSMLLFGLIFALLRRLAAQQRELEQHRDALTTAEVRATAGLMAASVAHDINNALTIAGADVEDLAKPMELSELELRDATQRLAGALGEISTLARRLAAAGRDHTVRSMELLDVAAVVYDAVSFARRHRDLRGIDLRLEAETPIAVLGVPELVRRALVNLLLNASYAVAGRGRVLVRLRPHPPGAVLEVHDDGPGVPPERRHSVFAPFTTTRPGGLGLGLLTVRACAEAHGGAVEVLPSEVLGGACFRLRLATSRGPAPRP